jgi:hypothetical protein
MNVTARMGKFKRLFMTSHIPKDLELSFAWLQGDKEVRKITVPVKAGPKWRTWTNKNLAGQKGDGKVEIKDGKERSSKK